MLSVSKKWKIFSLGAVVGIFVFSSFLTVFAESVDSDISINATVPAICGNGVEEGAEECDDGDLDDGDGCSSICEIEPVQQSGGGGGGGGADPAPDPVCGNRIIEAGETCDDGDTNNWDGCSSVCKLEPDPICGNGVQEQNEQCDDANRVDGDGCSQTCLLEPVCGNGVKEEGEACDDDNLVDGDGCSKVCQVEVEGAVCGNGVKEEGEACDDGNIQNGDGCSNACLAEQPLCGNAKVEAGEVCDDGNLQNGDGCSAQCKAEFGVCGNGIVEQGEACDDANRASWDGCSNVCQVEPDPVCGNAIVEQAEQCDDGNRQSGDGCSAQCVVEGVAAEENPVDGQEEPENPVDGPDEGNAGEAGKPGGENNNDGGEQNAGDNAGAVGGKDPGNGEAGNGGAGGRVENNRGSGGSQSGGGSGEKEEPGEAVPKSIFEGVKKSDPFTVQASTVAKNIVKKTQAVAKDVSEKVVEVAKKADELADDPQVEQVTKTVVAPATVGVAAAAVIPSAWNFLIPLMRLVFFQPLLLFGRKKRKAWGQVYNSFTKLPVDLAMVRLIDPKTKRVLQSRVTDTEGRYLFLAEEGEYAIEVTKPGFTFPSQFLLGQKSDGKILDLYHGESLTVQDKNVSVTPNIPLDPVDAQQPPERILREKWIRVLQHGVSLSGVFLTLISIYIAPVWYVWLMLLGHIVLYVLFAKFIRPKKPKGWGIVYEKQSVAPIKNAVVRLFTKQYNKLVATQVTDKRGRYAFLVGPSDYYVTFEKKGYVPVQSEDIQITESEKAALLKRDAGLEKQV